MDELFHPLTGANDDACLWLDRFMQACFGKPVNRHGSCRSAVSRWLPNAFQETVNMTFGLAVGTKKWRIANNAIVFALHVASTHVNIQ